MKCGLLGRTLKHSYSPRIHALLGDYPYVLYEKEPQELESFLRQEAFDGINVTMPYKTAVIPYLDELTPIAKELGAVNTIVRRNGRLIGHNTDHYGFLALLRRSGLSPAGKKCLVLGSGGASKVVCAVLREALANVVVISRQGEHNYDNLHLHSDAALLINTTPVGMYPDTGHSPINLDLFPKLEGVLDVIYNPARTQLLLDAEARGIPCANGLYMLVAQAMEASQRFTGCQVPEEKLDMVYRQLRFEMENILLIGMPGCGKSTVGKLLSEKTGRTFADCDALVEEMAKKSIPRIFAEDGEEAFRRLETAALSQLGKQSGLIIATGGGCVTRPENDAPLRQNGRIFWLQRDLDRLSTAGRPLSMAQPLNQLYDSRKDLYAALADHIVANNNTVDNTVSQILEVLL